ncbi:MAG TPA: aspartyl protease family protein, partial [Gammaproteobacteria bacterium]
ALDAERTLIDFYERKGDGRLPEAQNTLKLLLALSGIDPQKSSRSGDSHIILAASGRSYCIPVTVGIDPCYPLDVAAEYSILTRSEAARLKLKVIPAGVQVRTKFGPLVDADVALAPSLLLGNLQYQDVVFLVMPDAAFTFKGFTTPGVLGFPVLAGMGSLTVRRGHVMDVPKLINTKRVDDIALDGNELLTQVMLGDRTVLCRVDLSAEHSVFYKSYYDLYKDDVEKAGKPHSVHGNGITGVHAYQSYRLRDMQLSVAGRPVKLHNVDVFTEKRTSKDYLQCNLGQDAFKDYRSYTINLAAMSLTLD